MAKKFLSFFDKMMDRHGFSMLVVTLGIIVFSISCEEPFYRYTKWLPELIKQGEVSWQEVAQYVCKDIGMLLVFSASFLVFYTTALYCEGTDSKFVKKFALLRFFFQDDI